MDSVQALVWIDEPTTGVKASMVCRGHITEPECAPRRSSTFFPIFSPYSGYSLAMSAEPSLPDPDISDDDQHPTEASNRKRSSRGSYPSSPTLSRLIHLSLACDQCRKTKSKCERSKSDDDPCKSCLAAGTGTSLSLSYLYHETETRPPACTFLGTHPISPTPPL